MNVRALLAAELLMSRMKSPQMCLTAKVPCLFPLDSVATKPRSPSRLAKTTTILCICSSATLTTVLVALIETLSCHSPFLQYPRVRLLNRDLSLRYAYVKVPQLSGNMAIRLRFGDSAGSFFTPASPQSYSHSNLECQCRRSFVARMDTSVVRSGVSVHMSPTIRNRY